MTDEERSQTTAVAALYRFVRLDDYESMREPLLNFCKERGVKGTLLLAHEGVNGTISGGKMAIADVLSYLRSDERLTDLDCKFSYHEERPFLRMKVKLKREIVTMGLAGVDPNQSVGRYASPEEWNELVDDPECLVIDTRNDYEVEIGSFRGAINPGTKSFRDFPAWVDENLDPQKHKKVAMFCTGGIRCEKSTSLLVSKGFDDVWHLKGGILNYLEQTPEASTRWEGECFVFDSRVAVNHQLEKGQYDQCFACRFPLDDAQKESPQYVPGVSCPRCHDAHSADQKKRFSERQRQMALSRQRGEVHLGATPPARQRQ
ncbi:rhodanese-related sulfurtransferase [Luminiphilus sp.]|nr:rhodanese-related sulfurtransferase [Luminiphilus sp.]MDB2653962.1 rhodanese-related sulfurtransferase [Luminiphilus sp.]